MIYVRTAIICNIAMSAPRPDPVQILNDKSERQYSIVAN